MGDVKKQISDQTNKSFTESKRWMAALITLGAVLFIFLLSLLTIILTGGRSSSDIVSLANISIVFIGTLMSIVLTGASAISWKAISSLENINKTELETRKEDISIKQEKDENITYNINIKEFEKVEGINAPDIKPFSQRAIEE